MSDARPAIQSWSESDSPCVQDVRRVRDALWAASGHNLDAYCEQSKAFAARLRAQGHRVVTDLPRRDRLRDE